MKALTRPRASATRRPQAQKPAARRPQAIASGGAAPRMQADADAATPQSAPRYELQVRHPGPADVEYEIWQLPNAATPHLTAATRVAGLRGANLSLVEHRVLRRLAQSGIRLGQQAGGKERGHALTEDLALTLGLLFRTLAPMRNRENMRTVAEGIEAMQREEAAYWLGMAMHRKRPRRVLAALRVLLTEPRA